MIFNSLDFIIFFIIFLILYFSLRTTKSKVFLCLVGSYVFYGWWDWRFLSLILTSTLIDFYLGARIEKENNPIKKKKYLILSITANLGMLGIFKYFNFFIDSFHNITDLLGLGFNLTSLDIILPVGISFYTFQTMSYTIDIYKGKLQAERDFMTFATYVAFFPQLVAGPIVRASHLIPQFKINHKFDKVRIIEGFAQVLLGFFKKIVIADSIAKIVETGFSHPETFSSLNLIIIVFLYAFQIYCDFSGYSDIAIGIARMLGYNFPVNFRFPYFAKNFSDFWNRWHISLSSWLRDYLYFTLGGNRNGSYKTARNLMITMLLGGLWHGASWTFVFWGLLHGIYLIIQRKLPKFKMIHENIILNFISNSVKIFTTFTLVCLAWIFFRAQSFDSAFVIIDKILAFENMSLMSIKSPLLTLKVLILISFLVTSEAIYQRYPIDKIVLRRPILRYFVFSIFFWFILLFGTFSENQFIYFQF
jgi:alginate O-acetyltransferase complex protein AlgI